MDGRPGPPGVAGDKGDIGFPGKNNFFQSRPSNNFIKNKKKIVLDYSSCIFKYF